MLFDPGIWPPLILLNRGTLQTFFISSVPELVESLICESASDSNSAGLTPLGLLAAVVGMMMIPLTTLARQLYEGAGFFAQQQAAVIVVGVGLLLVIAVFAIAVWRVLRRVAAWLQSGAVMQANAALWALSTTALLVVLPVVLALLLPRHPAP